MSNLYFSNDMHVYIVVKERVQADYNAPYDDGSVIDKKSKHYKDLKKHNETNFNYLNKYIGSGEKLEVTRIELPCRDGGCLDHLRMTNVSIYDENTHQLYYFDVGAKNDKVVKNKEYYIVDWIIE